MPIYLSNVLTAFGTQRQMHAQWSTPEIIIVDNGSFEPSTVELLHHWQESIQVLRCDEPFNWSRLNNLAVAHATGELILMLNNDVFALQPGWIEAMAAQSFRPSVGAVGALLVYPDGTIQHGGMVIGQECEVHHAYRGLQPNHLVHRGRSQLLTAWLAVTGACFMLRRELLNRLGGFDEGYPDEFSDVEFCLRLSQLGYSCVIPNKAILVHRERQSRGTTNVTSVKQRLRHKYPFLSSLTQPWWPFESESNFPDGRPAGFKDINFLA